MAVELGFNKFLRYRHKRYKSVVFFTDLIKTRKDFYGKRSLNFPQYKSNFDLLLSFDPGESEKCGIVHHPLVNSKYEGQVKKLPMSDVYFLGQPKNRLFPIIETFEILRDSGLKLDFHLVNVRSEQQVYKDEIHYHEDFMTYNENLQHTLHSRCLLEVMQQGGLGYTQRVMEAICEGKKLLTNNATIKEAPFYNPRYISHFTSIDDIDRNFLKAIPIDKYIDYHYMDKISPVELIHFIDERL